MLSNKVQRIPIDSIHINREARQRAQVDVSDILESVKRRGVLTPICVTESGTLIFGERRLTAARACGHTEILARIAPDTLSPFDLQLLELEENLMRQDLPWQDKAKAMQRMFALRREENPALSASAFAEGIGYDRRFVDKMLEAAAEIEKGNQRVAQATSYIKATNVIVRQRERQQQNIIADILDTIGTSHEPEIQPLADDILLHSFHDWASSYSGPKFNLIHCDFPYGVGIDTSDQLQVGSTAHQVYDDSPETFWALVDTLITHHDRFVSASAHMIFWYSMKYHTQLVETFARRLPAWTFEDYPLVWLKSDNKGIAPDVQRRPRRIYETALFGWRGDRKLVKLASNAYAAPKEASAHPSTKPEPVLRHFFQMVVDPNTRLLDPTCGSGSALRAAESLGASYVLGLEMDPEFHGQALAKLRAFRSTNALAGRIA